MINKGIEQGNYERTEDNTLDDLDKFQSFLYRNFENYKNYEQMRPTSNQPARIYGTAKTHKSENPDNITLELLNNLNYDQLQHKMELRHIMQLK